MTITGKPPRSRWTSITSRVVPASSDTIADVALRKRIQQRRLAGVRRSGDDHAEAVAEAFAAPVGKVRRHGGEQLGDGRVSLHRGVGGDVGLVGEVEACFGERLRLHQLLAPGLVERPRPALGLRDRLARLRLGLGGDEIGKAFDLGEIDPPVLEGAARELARLGQAHATERSERLDHAADHGAAAMNMQLGDVLAGEARGPRQPEREPAVEHLAGPRVPDLAQARLARRRRRTAQRAERVSRSRPRDADDRDACPARRARQRADGVPFGSWNSTLHGWAFS